MTDWYTLVPLRALEVTDEDRKDTEVPAAV